MTLRIKIEVPTNGGPYEAQVSQSNGNPAAILAPGDSLELYIHSGNTISVTELPAGSKAKAAGDFALGQACNNAGEGACEACQ